MKCKGEPYEIRKKHGKTDKINVDETKYQPLYRFSITNTVADIFCRIFSLLFR